jgi:hypothetical protein
MIKLRCKNPETALIRFGSWLFSNSGRALALPARDAEADVSAVIL